MIKIEEPLYQWDTNRYVLLDEDSDVNFALVGADQCYTVASEDCRAKIPNELLQEGADISVWRYKDDHTLEQEYFGVWQKPKPVDYEDKQEQAIQKRIDQAVAEATEGLVNKKDVYKNLIEDRTDDYKYGEALLKEVIPNITVIGNEAFYGIRGFNWTAISDNAILEDSKRYPRKFFSNIKEIRKNGLNYVFYRMSSTPQSMPYNFYASFDSLEKLGEDALRNFHFTHVNFPNLSSIDSYTALPYSYNLIWVRFDSLKRIEGTSKYFSLLDNRGDSYYKNDKLKAIVLSSNTLVTLKNSIALIGPPTADICPISPSYTGSIEGYIYVPKALIEDYKTATNWSVFEDKFRAIEDYPEICNEGV